MEELFYFLKPEQILPESATSMMNPTLNKCIIIINAKLCNKHPNPKISWSHLGHCKWCRPAIKSTQVQQHIVGLHIPSVEDRWGHSVHQAQSTKVLRECKQERFKFIVMQHDLYPKRICNTRQLAKLVLSNLPASAPAPLSAVNPWQTWHCSSRLSTFLAWNAEVFCPIFWWPSIKQSKFPQLESKQVWKHIKMNENDFQVEVRNLGSMLTLWTTPDL